MCEKREIEDGTCRIQEVTKASKVGNSKAGTRKAKSKKQKSRKAEKQKSRKAEKQKSRKAEKQKNTNQYIQEDKNSMKNINYEIESFIKDEEAVGVIEVVLILVEIFTI